VYWGSILIILAPSFQISYKLNILNYEEERHIKLRLSYSASSVEVCGALSDREEYATYQAPSYGVHMHVVV